LAAIVERQRREAEKAAVAKKPAAVDNPRKPKKKRSA